MKKIITALLSTILLVGCNSTSSEQNSMSSKVERDLNPSASEAELKQLVNDNNEFAFALYENLNDGENNTFFSPTSITHALMMTYAGASGETKTEMKTALHLTLEDERVHETFNKLDLGLNTIEDTYTFQLANAIWPSDNFEFEQSYLDTIMLNYGAGLKTLDYTHKPEESRNEINNWVETQTQEKIKDLIPEGAITPMTKMVLTNAVYFNGRWEHPFNPENSEKGLFNNTIETDFMHQTEIFPYYEDENLQAIKLAYETGKSSMVLFLSKGDTLTRSAFEILDHFEDYKVTLKMPKFEFTSQSISLVESMRNLGMRSAFDSNSANFNLLSSNSALYIGDIIHKAFIKVDENGTEAAAATAVAIEVTGTIVGVPTANLTLDRPFVYMIIDDETDQILFLGHMLKP